MNHILKTDPEPFALSATGRKPFEIRLNDRGFEAGDTLELRETVFSAAEMAEGSPLEYTGNSLERRVVSVVEGYGLMDGYVVLGLDR